MSHAAVAHNALTTDHFVMPSSRTLTIQTLTLIMMRQPLGSAANVCVVATGGPWHAKFVSAVHASVLAMVWLGTACLGERDMLRGSQTIANCVCARGDVIDGTSACGRANAKQNRV